jgi:hypothetical protein
LPDATQAFVLGLGARSLLQCRGAGLARAGAADVGELPVISDDLLACVGDVRAKGGEEIECRAGGGEGRVRAGAAIMTSA